jgi:uncharacterized protein YggT (Ycf19 family)
MGRDGSLGAPFRLLCRVTDPYLGLFRRFPVFRRWGVDLSSAAALAALSVAGSIVTSVLRYGRISVGVLLAIALSAIDWAASFLLGLFAVLLILRLASVIFRVDRNAPFWRLVNAASAPVIARMKRLLFPRRFVREKTGLALSIAALAAAGCVLGILVRVFNGLFLALPF